MFINVDRLKGGYHNNTVFSDISFNAKEGEMIYVLGANGCGKTTLFNIVVGYKDRMDGNISINNQDITNLSKQEKAKLIAYIPQHHTPAFNYSVKDIVVMGRASHLSMAEVPHKGDYDIVMNTLDMLGIKDLAYNEYKELSGGQRQLVLIARAICQQSKIIVMDEPLQNLDFVNQAMVTQTLRYLVKKGYIIIMSTHTAINSYSQKDKVLLMSKDGKGSFGFIEEIVNNDTMNAAYGMPVQTIFGEVENGGKYLFCLPK